jgi:hypothetical protein
MAVGSGSAGRRVERNAQRWIKAVHHARCIGGEIKFFSFYIIDIGC